MKIDTSIYTPCKIVCGDSLYSRQSIYQSLLIQRCGCFVNKTHERVTARPHSSLQWICNPYKIKSNVVIHMALTEQNPDMCSAIQHAYHTFVWESKCILHLKNEKYVLQS
eukprot:745715_1